MKRYLYILLLIIFVIALNVTNIIFVDVKLICTNLFCFNTYLIIFNYINAF